MFHWSFSFLVSVLVPVVSLACVGVVLAIFWRKIRLNRVKRHLRSAARVAASTNETEAGGKAGELELSTNNRRAKVLPEKAKLPNSATNRGEERFNRRDFRISENWSKTLFLEWFTISNLNLTNNKLVKFA